jgi:hypothetical protein
VVALCWHGWPGRPRRGGERDGLAKTQGQWPISSACRSEQLLREVRTKDPTVPPQCPAGHPDPPESRLKFSTRTYAHHQPALAVRWFNRISGARGAWGHQPSFFLSPTSSSKFIWGAGPTFTLPTATDWRLGGGKFSLGPTAVALTMQGPWVIGALANNQWSVAGWGEKDVNQLLVQPFVNYNIGDGWYLTSSPIMTSNWEARSSDHWTVPVGAGVGKLFRLGRLPINTSLQAYYNVEKPKYAADWQLRFQVQFLLRFRQVWACAMNTQSCTEAGDATRRVFAGVALAAAWCLTGRMYHGQGSHEHAEVVSGMAVWSQAQKPSRRRRGRVRPRQSRTSARSRAASIRVGAAYSRPSSSSDAAAVLPRP